MQKNKNKIKKITTEGFKLQKEHKHLKNTIYSSSSPWYLYTIFDQSQRTSQVTNHTSLMKSLSI